MAATAKGWPYPLGTDRLMDGDNAIAALAAMLDTRLSFGVWSTSVLATAAGALNTPVNVTVTFPAGQFANAPFVCTTAIAASPQNKMTGVTGITATGCTAVAVQTAGALTNTTIEIIAHSF